MGCGGEGVMGGGLFTVMYNHGTFRMDHFRAHLHHDHYRIL